MGLHSDPSTSLTVRGDRGGGGGGASSVVSHSRSSLSRARRYNRSHAGGAGAYVPQNEFPVFSHSGDVEIVVRVASGHENRYLLHRHTLTRCSGFFEASTSNEWSRAGGEQALPELLPGPSVSTAVASGNELARIGEDNSGSSDVASNAGTGTRSSRPAPLATPKRRWRYELDWGDGDDDIPMLVQRGESSSGAQNGYPPPTGSLFGGPQAPPPPPPYSHSHHAGHGSSRSKSISSSSRDASFFRSVANLSLAPLAAPPLPPPSLAEQDLLRDYDNLFRIMYNYPPVLDGINIADAYLQCKTLLALADQYDALAVVGPRVDHHLLQFQGRLWKQVAKYPISYLRLGYLARSRVIFQEALIHVVGQWPAGERSLRANLPEQVLDLIEDKVDELDEAVARVEARLFRLTLTTRAGERVTPATGYLEWLAVSLFRQWLADNTTPPPPPPPPPDRRNGQVGGGGGGGGSRGRDGAGGTPTTRPPVPATLSPPASAPPPLAALGRTYRILGGSGGSAGAPGYLGHDECKRFLKLTPELYSRDNLRRFEKRVDELRAAAREIVRPLMGSGLELDLSGSGGGSGGSGGGGGGGGGGGQKSGMDGSGGIGYLTCTKIVDRDLPWPVDR